MRLSVTTALFVLSRSLDLENYANEQSFIAQLPGIDLATISHLDIEKIVLRQWFEAAGELIRKSHESDIDISAPIRSGAQEVRTRIDELVKLLDPDYSKPQRVNPAFQWTQNDTAVFIQLKYSRRFNAPGSVDVTGFNCTFTDSMMLFSAIGGHSGKMFEYVLELDFFDSIDSSMSRWSEGSVGKVSLTIMKVRSGKWPRLLLLPTLKIDNMHYWYDFGEKQDYILNSMPTMSESPQTCQLQALIYCPVSDKCVSSCDETLCVGKSHQKFSLCEGPPSFSFKEIKFNDTDFTRGSVAGVIEVFLRKSSHQYDTNYASLYYVDKGAELLDDTPLIGKSYFVSSNKTEFRIERFTTVPTEIVAVPGNDFGENREKAIRITLEDFFAPTNCAQIANLQFTDIEADKRSIRGIFTYDLPVDTDGAVHFAFCWGRNLTDKLNSKKCISENSSTSETFFNLTVATSIPTGATHVLIFPVGPGGAQSGTPIANVAIVDNFRPDKEYKPTNVELVSTDTQSFVKFTRDNAAEFYSVRVSNAKGQSKELALIQEPPTDPTVPINSPTFNIKPSYTKLCVYAGNEMGRANEGACIDLPTNNPETPVMDEL